MNNKSNSQSENKGEKENKKTTSTQKQEDSKQTQQSQSSCQSGCKSCSQGETKSQQKGKSDSQDSQSVDNQKCKFLNNLYKNLETASSSIDILLPKVDNEKLTVELQKQMCEYQKVSSDIATQITKCGCLPKSNNIIKKATMWSSIQMNTMLNTKGSHIADMVIQGTNMGITSVNKDINEYSVDSSCTKIANEVLSMYEKNIQSLNSYL